MAKRVVTQEEREAAGVALAKVSEQLEALDRAPFRAMLAEFLGVQPTKAALRRFANKSPDRWAQALAILGSLAGFTKDSTQINIFAGVRGLTDAELLREAQHLGLPVNDPKLLGSVPSTPEGEVIEGEVVEVEREKEKDESQ